MQSELSLYSKLRNAARTALIRVHPYVAASQKKMVRARGGRLHRLSCITSTYLKFFLAALVAPCSASNVLKASAS
jgi:hypothetical protein